MWTRIMLIALSLAAAPALAILGRHDLSPEAYLVDEAELPAVGRLDERTEAVLVADRWLLTAAHTVDMLSTLDESVVRLGGACYAVDRIVVHPRWEGDWNRLHRMHDLALLELDRPVEAIEAVHLYAGNDELGRVVELAGRGRSGNGRDGPAAEKDGRMRRGTNRIAAVTETTLFLFFDEPSDATDLEAIGGAGDSGGPALLEIDGHRYLAGIGSATTGVAEVSEGLYGTADLYTRVSGFEPWIRGVIAGVEGGTEWASSESCGAGLWPDHTAGRLAKSFFDAYAAGTREEMRRFFREREVPSGNDERADRVFDGVVERYGPVEARRCASLGSDEMRALVRARETSEWFSVGFVADAADEDRLGRLYMKPQRTPGSRSRCEEHLGGSS